MLPCTSSYLYVSGRPTSFLLCGAQERGDDKRVLSPLPAQRVPPPPQFRIPGRPARVVLQVRLVFLSRARSLSSLSSLAAMRSSAQLVSITVRYNLYPSSVDDYRYDTSSATGRLRPGLRGLVAVPFSDRRLRGVTCSSWLFFF